MSDIVERLRSPASVFYEYSADNGALLKQAADEIEKLRAELKQARRDALEEAARWLDQKENELITMSSNPRLWTVQKEALELARVYKNCAAAIRALGEKEAVG